MVVCRSLLRQQANLKKAANISRLSQIKLDINRLKSFHTGLRRSPLHTKTFETINTKGSSKQTKKLSATTEADEGKPKPETFTKEPPNVTVRGAPLTKAKRSRRTLIKNKTSKPPTGGASL